MGLIMAGEVCDSTLRILAEDAFVNANSQSVADIILDIWGSIHAVGIPLCRKP